VISSGWYLPHLRDRFHPLKYPLAIDLGYHSPKPIFGDETHFMYCWVLDGECYYNGSTLEAQPILEKLISEGDEAVWRELEKFYKDIFEKSKGE